MIRKPAELLAALEAFEDTATLVEQLRKIAADDTISGPDQYYLRETAVHLESLYSLAQEMSRALPKSMEYPISESA